MKYWEICPSNGFYKWRHNIYLTCNSCELWYMYHMLDLCHITTLLIYYIKISLHQASVMFLYSIRAVLWQKWIIRHRTLPCWSCLFILSRHTYLWQVVPCYKWTVNSVLIFHIPYMTSLMNTPCIRWRNQGTFLCENTVLLTTLTTLSMEYWVSKSRGDNSLIVTIRGH